jgi:hypothetical protein
MISSKYHKEICYKNIHTHTQLNYSLCKGLRGGLYGNWASRAGPIPVKPAIKAFNPTQKKKAYKSLFIHKRE